MMRRRHLKLHSTHILARPPSVPSQAAIVRKLVGDRFQAEVKKRLAYELRRWHHIATVCSTIGRMVGGRGRVVTLRGALKDMRTRTVVLKLERRRFLFAGTNADEKVSALTNP